MIKATITMIPVNKMIPRTEINPHQDIFTLPLLATNPLPPEITQSIIEKGSIAIDGVSLTAFDIRSDRFSIALIPHTLKYTILGAKKSGDKVNIEIDMLGKYIQKLIPQKPSSGFRLDDGF